MTLPDLEVVNRVPTSQPGVASSVSVGDWLVKMFQRGPTGATASFASPVGRMGLADSPSSHAASARRAQAAKYLARMWDPSVPRNDGMRPPAPCRSGAGGVARGRVRVWRGGDNDGWASGRTGDADGPGARVSGGRRGRPPAGPHARADSHGL